MKTLSLKVVVWPLLGGILLLHGLLAWRARDLIRAGYPDFTNFYAAGKILDQGLGPRLYQEGTQLQVQQRFAAGVEIRRGALPYMHPPFEALLFVPFSKLSYGAAFLLWDALSLLLLLLTASLARARVAGLEQLSLPLSLLAGLALFPVFLALLQGQDSFILLLLVALAWQALRKGAGFEAGCCLGLGLFRFHLVLPLVLVCLWRRPRGMAAGFVLTAACLAALSIWLVGWPEAAAYPGYLWHLESGLANGAIVPAAMPNLRGLLALVLPAAAPAVREGIVVLGSLALLAWVATKWENQGSELRQDLGFCLLVLGTLVVAYHSFAHDLSLLFLPLLLLWGHWQEKKKEWDFLSHWALLGPPLVVAFSPLALVLLFRYSRLSLMVPVLLLWMGGIARELKPPAALPSGETSGSGSGLG